ncbi:hypothetical protein [Candidatus Villigracilis affinis]|uniref:hypothetical protein n=1 Tax=Candidatus Villigracilis affinis TaxID=3140682 RepID=UPI001DB3C0E9|nr:hypothetical protein [Anaerolineales bacterium]
MKQSIQKKQKRAIPALFWLFAIVFILACNLTNSGVQQQPAFDPTKAALELQATTVALQMTQSALNAQPAAVQPTAPQRQSNLWQQLRLHCLSPLPRQMWKRASVPRMCSFMRIQMN